MKKSHVDVIFDRRKKVAKTGKGLAEFRLYLARGVRKYIPISEITPAEWEHFTESSVLQNQLQDYENKLSAIEYLGKPLTLETLNEALGIEIKKTRKQVEEEEFEEKVNGKDGFILFFYDELAAEKIDIRTRQAREVVYNSLLTYGRIKDFSDLTPAKILDYDKWLRAEGDRTDVTIKSYHKRLHRYVLKAYEYGYITRDPYKSVTIPTGHSSERRPLSEW